MTDYVQQLTTPRYPFEKREATRYLEWFETKATVTDGIVRWNSNHSVPPRDILALWAHCEKPFDLTRSAAIGRAETDQFLADYRAMQAHTRPSPEEVSQARAAHGPGVTLTDVISGRAYTT